MPTSFKFGAVTDDNDAQCLKAPEGTVSNGIVMCLNLLFANECEQMMTHEGLSERLVSAEPANAY